MASFSVKNSRGLALHGEIMVPEKQSHEAVISFHGLFDSRENRTIAKINAALLKEGYTAITFDYTGHGTSEGSLKDLSLSQVLSDKDCIISYAEGLGYKKYFLMGRSFGAYPVLYEAAKNRNVMGVMLYNPATDMIALMQRKQTGKELTKYTTEHMKTPVFQKAKFFFELLVHNIYKASEMIMCPVFVFHSIDDEIVPHTQSKKLERHIHSEKRFLFLRCENHNCEATDLLEKKIIPETVTWMRKIRKD